MQIFTHNFTKRLINEAKCPNHRLNKRIGMTELYCKFFGFKKRDTPFLFSMVGVLRKPDVMNHVEHYG